MNVIIRKEEEKDHKIVYEVVRSAFEKMEKASGDEQDLVNRLRKSDAFIPELSLVAEINGKIVGHILFTKCRIGDNISLALAPVSVIPAYQGRGVGGKLIEEGHRIAKELGYGSAILVGHPTYYPRFGYRPASKWNIKAPFEVPDECFLAIELIKSDLNGVKGILEYPKEFFEKG